MRKWIGSVAVVAMTVVSCSRKAEPPPAPTVAELKSPAAPGSGMPDLSVGPDGQIYLSWLEPAGDEQALRFSTLGSQGEWSPPQTIAHGNDWFVSAADFPTVIALPDGTLAADWFVTTQLETEAYDIKLVFSHDKGATWSNPMSPHRDKKKRQHGFPSIVPSGSNQLSAIWLDGKNLPESDLIGDMALMYTTVGTDGTLGPETQLDDRVCECCRTSITATPNGLIAVYRDRSEKEIRDISIVRYANGAWSQPEPLSKDGWEIFGCPVNGPAISSNGENVAVAWFTAPNEQPRTNVVMSTDGGKTFGQPVRFDLGKPVGRVDVLSLPTGAALVSWLERTDNGTRVRLRQVDAKGVAGAPIAVSEQDAPMDSVTRLERLGDDVIVAWTDAEQRVRTARVKF